MIEKMKASKRKVAKRGGNVTKAKVRSAGRIAGTPPKGKLQAPTSMLNSKGKKEKLTREVYGTVPKNIEYNKKTKNRGSGAPLASTKGQPKSVAKKVPTKIATGVKRSMTASDARGLRYAMATGKMSNLNKEVNSMKSRRPNKVTTRYKK
tara:strand:- start:50 stop:499 length:450 start_codon:yes stop_codon:yes gene_type:complete